MLQSACAAHGAPPRKPPSPSARWGGPPTSTFPCAQGTAQRRHPKGKRPLRIISPSSTVVLRQRVPSMSGVRAQCSPKGGTWGHAPAGLPPRRTLRVGWGAVRWGRSPDSRAPFPVVPRGAPSGGWGSRTPQRRGHAPTGTRTGDRVPSAVAAGPRDLVPTAPGVAAREGPVPTAGRIDPRVGDGAHCARRSVSVSGAGGGGGGSRTTTTKGPCTRSPGEQRSKRRSFRVQGVGGGGG